MIDRVKLAAERGWSVQEIYKAKDAWRKLYARQPSSEMTFEQYLDLMAESGLRPDNVGLRRGQYHLARLNDSGAYVLGNCRFIPQEANQRERKEGYQARPEFRSLISDLARARRRIRCPHCDGDYSPGMFTRWHGNNCKAAP
jgi:hypothetical protein